VLSHSRKGYSEVVWRQTTESFIRCLENGFRHYGGVVKTLVIDNLRVAVTQADWFDPELNPKMEDDTRIHGTTRLRVGKVFNEVERSKLLPLPSSLFPVFEEAPRTVHRDGYIELQRSYYSVPPEYVGRQVWARWESRLVRVFNQRREVIAVHVLAEPGKFTTDPNHLHSAHRHVIQQSLENLLVAPG
jgi:hypothetical protein